MADAGYVYVPTPEEREARLETIREHCRSVSGGRADAFQSCIRDEEIRRAPRAGRKPTRGRGPGTL